MNSSVTAIKPEPRTSLISQKYHRIFITMTWTEICTDGSEENVQPVDPTCLCRLQTHISGNNLESLHLKIEKAKGCRTELPEMKCRSFESWEQQPAQEQPLPHPHYGLCRLREKGMLWGRATITGWHSSNTRKKWETPGTEPMSMIGRVCTIRKDLLWRWRNPAVHMPKNQRDDICRVWNNI